MNFGNFGVLELGFVLLVWALPVALLVWFIRTLTAMSLSLRTIADRLATLEQAVRDAARPRAT